MRKRSIRALLAAAIVLFPTSAAYALPTPYVLVLAGDVLLQALLLLLLLGPMGAQRLRTRLYRRLPTRAGRALAFTVLFGLPTLLPWLADTPGYEPMVTECLPLPGAAELGLPTHAIVIDPRPAAAFAAYHLRGSCNRRLDAIDVAGPLFIADDSEFPAHEIAVLRGRGLDAHALPGGLQPLYRPGETGVGFGQAPTWIVDWRGRPVARVLGPLWFMGAQSPTVAALPRMGEAALHREGVVIDLRNRDGDLPAYDAYPEHLEDVPTLLLCDDPPTCLAADALGAAAPQVVAKVHTLRSLEEIRAEPVFGDQAAILWIAIAALCSFWFASKPWSVWFAPTLGAGSLWFVPRLFDSVLVFFPVDAPWLLSLAWLLCFAWLFVVEHRRGQVSKVARILAAFFLLSLAAAEVVGQAVAGLSAMSLLLFLAGFVGLLRSERASGAASPLRIAHRFAGGKAERLGEIWRRGLAVPRGVVIEDGWSAADLETCRRLLGEGPLVVRSSAVGEDDWRQLSAGKYLSIRDVSFAQLAKAIVRVRAAYEDGAVLVQQQMDGMIAGVAEDVALGLIRLESSAGGNASITSGEGGEYHGLISPRGQSEGIPRSLAAQLRQAHARIQSGTPIQSEWSWDGRTLWILQARNIKPEPALNADAATLVRTLRQNVLSRGTMRVLDGNELAEFDGASDGTLALLERFLGAGRWRKRAEALLGFSVPAPQPAVVRLGGRLYLNQLIPNPVRQVLAAPWRRFLMPWIWLRRWARLRTLQAALVHAQETDPNLDLAAPPAIALALLASVLRITPELAGDPFLEALAGDPEHRAPGRASPDLMLELPREGEVEVMPVLDVDTKAPFASEISRLRGQARTLLARAIVDHRDGLGAAELKPVPLKPMPDGFDLIGLEAFALDGTTHGETRAGVWIGQPAPGSYTVGVTLFLVDVPGPSEVAAHPADAVLVAKRGSRLCHGALIARQRNLQALFSVGDVSLASGDRILLRRDGTITPLDQE